MKGKVILSTLVLVLLLATAAAFAVLAERGTAPHDGQCVAACAQAFVFMEDAQGNWVATDFDGDGQVERCLREFDPSRGETMCHKMGPPVCPESGDHCQTKAEAMAQSDPTMRFYCGLVDGADAHPGGD